jgi:hypothetical protein
MVAPFPHIVLRGSGKSGKKMVKNFNFCKDINIKYAFGLYTYYVEDDLFQGEELKLRSYVRYRCILKNISS